MTMIKIAALQLNPFQENTYVVSDPSGDCIIIDAGNYGVHDNRKLSAYIDENSLKPTMAINTHGHIDHILGVDYAKKSWSIPFALHSEDNFLVASAPEHAKIYGFNIDVIPSVEKDLKGVDQIQFGETTLQIIHTPGHTPGHICLYEPQSKSLFTGDTLFKESIGRTDLPGGDYSWIMKSILEKIIPLGSDVKIYPGHGSPSDIGHELLYNPFITEVLQGEVNANR